MKLFVLTLCALWSYACAVDTEEIGPTFRIEGKVSVVGDKHKSSDWMLDTDIFVDGGDYKGFLKSDGTFVVASVPSGSHLIEVSSPNYAFERYRVDITKGGKIRARHANFLQPNAVQVVPYPLRFVARKQAAFFEIREEWKVTDFLFNPMVLMMLLPVLFVVVMPKLISMADPEAQKEMQSQMSMLSNQKQMPDLSEMISSLFVGDDGKKKKSGASEKSTLKRAGKRR